MMPLSTPSVLIIDDEPALRLALRVSFVRQQWRAEAVAGLQEATSALERERFSLVLCDMRLEDGDGFSVVEAIQRCAPGTPLLFLTAHASVPEAVRAMQCGAFDYLTKPVSFDHLHLVALRAIRIEASSRQVEPTVTALAGGMVGRSRELQASLSRARAAAESDADVLIEAESGTGKELLARLIHEGSGRRDGPFIAINCAALPESLLESELFGHAKGAFTGALAAKPGKFELAHGGTLLLDEIGDMPLNLQPKLLRVLQERVVERLGETRSRQTNIRVIAATNLHLSSRVDQGLFRSDLFYRLNVIPLSLPPLRERMDDVPCLAMHFAGNFAAKTGSRPARLSSSFLERLATYSWPGNVRELANFMQRVLSMCGTEGELVAAHFDREHRPVHMMQPVPTPEVLKVVGNDAVSLDQMERSHLQRTLELVGGNRTRAAEMLGISVRTMRNKIRQYDLPPRRYA